MIITYWNNLNERERIIVSIGIACVLIYLFYLLVYHPLINTVHFKSAQLKEKQATLLWMQQIREQSKNEKTTQPITNTRLLALIGNQLTQNNLKQFPYQLEQTGSGDIQLSYARVPFNPFLFWLWNLNKDYAITLKQYTSERTDTAGIVKLNIVITANQ
ncbi:type II secretion system protein GspM [Legionella fairfieldensis]|uniref:type II secretion system protein GspM n=1 Tax=Legionella fairfieldensis TaxID=45064 RepID=UPI001F5E8687|nr:type II secretion system protein GspM [Legionella fairfieldensis]